MRYYIKIETTKSSTIKEVNYKQYLRALNTDSKKCLFISKRKKILVFYIF